MVHSKPYSHILERVRLDLLGLDTLARAGGSDTVDSKVRVGDRTNANGQHSPWLYRTSWTYPLSLAQLRF